MQTIADLSVDQILCFLMALMRTATLLAVFPILGARSTPRVAKVGLAFILAMILFPLIPTHNIEFPTGMFSFALIIAKEMLIGLLLGFSGSLIFESLQFAGRIIDQQMGFAMAQIMDPVTNNNVTLIAQFNTMFFSIIFLMIGGHRIFIDALAYSFTIIDLGGVNFDATHIAEHLIHMTGQIFVLGLRFSAPVAISLLLTTTALGIIARTVPQMNIFVVGLPLKIGMGLIILIVTFPTLIGMFEEMLLTLESDIYVLLKYLS